MFLWVSISLFIGNVIFICMIMKAAAPFGDFEFPHDTYAADVVLPEEKKIARKLNWRVEMTDYGVSCFVVSILAVAAFVSFFEISWLYLIVPAAFSLVCIPIVVLVVFASAKQEMGFFSFLFKSFALFFKNLFSCFVSKWYEYATLIVVITVYISSLYYFGTNFFL